MGPRQQEDLGLEKEKGWSGAADRLPQPHDSSPEGQQREGDEYFASDARQPEPPSHAEGSGAGHTATRKLPEKFERRSRASR